MCARRFLMVVFVLTLLVVAGAFAIFQWGGQLLLDTRGTPVGHFQASAAGSGPGLCRRGQLDRAPELAANPAHWLPDGVRGRAHGRCGGLLHPPHHLSPARPLERAARSGGDTELRTRLFVQSQASAFNGAGEIWAPRYRQAAFGAFLLSSKDARKALDLAYADVAAAFDRFIAEAGDRPIILAAHSQGALHLDAPAQGQGCGKADREADRRRLCGRLAASRHRRPAGDGPPAVHGAGPDRLCAVVDELRRSGQSRPRAPFLFAIAGFRRRQAHGARTCCASTRSAACATPRLRRKPIPEPWCPSADLLSAQARAGYRRRALRPGAC